MQSIIGGARGKTTNESAKTTLIMALAVKAIACRVLWKTLWMKRITPLQSKV
jgi:hypothetical protein